MFPRLPYMYMLRERIYVRQGMNYDTLPLQDWIFRHDRSLALFSTIVPALVCIFTVWIFAICNQNLQYLIFCPTVRSALARSTLVTRFLAMYVLSITVHGLCIHLFLWPILACRLFIFVSLALFACRALPCLVLRCRLRVACFLPLSENPNIMRTFHLAKECCWSLLRSARFAPCLVCFRWRASSPFVDRSAGFEGWVWGRMNLRICPS